MTKQRTTIKVSGIVVALGFYVAMLPMYGCAQRQFSADQKQQLVQQLGTAKSQDEAVATDTTANPTQAEDATVQAYKADRRARDLENGYYVSETKLEHSLEVPPKTLSAEQKAELIEQLKQAKQLDEREAEYAAEENSQVSQDSYQRHQERVDSVLKEMEIGEDVPWSRIQSALEVPKNP
ncbi:MAG: hypothetical protein WA005_09920 [Candidatus Binataceae bacterium]